MEPRGAFFREIHKNSWLKRLTSDGKRLPIGPKRSERVWVVFCVHDDTDALLEGYIDSKSAGSHVPEWVFSLKNTQHISHALVHNDKEYEFVITLDNGIIRFLAASWEMMQEWVDVLRQKLREMKILSPRENLYTKFPEGRVPLLPTRDPTSPLPATPPVPAAIVPGIECITTTPPLSGVATTTTTTTAAAIATVENRSSSENLSINEDNTPTSIQTSAIVHQETTAIFPQRHLQTPYRSDLHSNSLNVINSENSDIIESQSIVENDTQENISAEKVTNPSIINSENSIRVDVTANTKSETLDIITVLRPELTTTTLTTEATNNSILNKIDTSKNVDKTESFSSMNNNGNCSNSEINGSDSTNIMIIQVSNPEPITTNQNRGEIFKFPPPENLTEIDNFKSNVHIIPSCLDYISQYSSPVKISASSSSSSSSSLNVKPQVTTVKVSSNINGDNNLQLQQQKLPEESNNTLSQQISKWPEKIILSTNTSGITNISVGNETSSSVSFPSTHYDKVFFAPSSLSSASNTPLAVINKSQQQEQQQSPRELKSLLPSISTVPSTSSNIKLKKENIGKNNQEVTSPKNRNIVSSTIITAGPSSSNAINVPIMKKQNSPMSGRKKMKPIERGRENVPPPLPIIRRPLLTRGATEAVITARPSRIDFVKRTITATDPSNNNNNNNINSSATVTERTRSESRRRSSSVSERLQSNNADTSQNYHLQQSQQQHIQRLQPFRFAHENKSTNASKKLTLREQQVMQLRREIMHPGGVRLQLRKKDCLNAIAWVDVFGTVWVAGWKQKEHPMLYNALHIGDQLISIAGNTIKTAAEANKIIRNSNTLFLEILIRRVPFGRVYAIRREIEGQCLGLIRDGNSATIVDVVPNSLSARHGLTPKAKSCDGLSLTFWVLTEINGRPLNLFCKDNEVHDRLNSVGRDISILVQPLDLITKLRKQLKSIRSFKDYIIQ